MSAQHESRTLSSEVIPTGETATVRVDDTFTTDIADLWSALVDPGRLARWIARVEGEFRLGGRFSARFTSGWEGVGEVEVCEPPRRLKVRTWDDISAPTFMEAQLWTEGAFTRLRIEEHGLPLTEAQAHADGWQVHVEDLEAHLGGRPTSDWRTRWSELSKVNR